MGNRNRTAGNNFERKVVEKINKKSLGQEISAKEIALLHESVFKVLPKVGTTRRLSRALDAKKVDVTTENPDRIGEFPYLIQAKSIAATTIPYPKLLDDLKEHNSKGIPIVVHQRTVKAEKKFMVQGEYVCMFLDDFIDIIVELAKLKLNVRNKD